MNKHVSRYIVDERGGIAAILDTEHEEFQDRGNGLHGDEPFLVRQIDGEYSQTKGHWSLNKDELASLYEGCRLLNKGI